jgi:MFS family permease
MSMAAAGSVQWGTRAGRGVVAATVLSSGLAFLDGTSTNVALPAIGEELGASVGGLQWTVTAYTLSLAALILLGGSLSDRFGRRRIVAATTSWGRC